MTQASHLLEHLVCYGSSASFRQQEAMDTLNAQGMANAETLPSRTHYDYMLPADNLAFAIRIEKERLTRRRSQSGRSVEGRVSSL